MGLFLVKTLTQKLNGNLEIKSVLNKGTIVQVKIKSHGHFYYNNSNK